MALTKTTVIDEIRIKATGHVEIRTVVTAFDDDGSQIGQRYSRRTINPEDDISNEPPKIRQICLIARS